MFAPLEYQAWPCQHDSEAGPSLLIIHGLFGAAVNWSSYAQILSLKYSVLALELPAHGSSGEADDLLYASMADRLAADLQAKKTGPWIVIGHSMGGKLAMMLALRHAELIESLVVVDMAPKQFYAKHDGIFAALAAVPLATLKNRSEGINHLNADLADPTLAAFLAKSLLAPSSENPEWHWRFNLRALSAGYHHVGDWPMDLQVQFHGPCLVIRGALSDYVLDEDLDYFRQLFPHLECQTIANAGHWVHVEQREAFLVCLQNWLNYAIYG